MFTYKAAIGGKNIYYAVAIVTAVVISVGLKIEVKEKQVSGGPLCDCDSHGEMFAIVKLLL